MVNEKRNQININISLTDKERKKLEEIAEDEDRSLARHVSFIVRKYLKDQESKNKND